MQKLGTYKGFESAQESFQNRCKECFGQKRHTKDWRKGILKIFKDEAFCLIGARALSVFRIFEKEIQDEQIINCMQDWGVFRDYINRLDSELMSV